MVKIKFLEVKIQNLTKSRTKSAPGKKRVNRIMIMILVISAETLNAVQYESIDENLSIQRINPLVT